jgi:cystathionine beta-lyase/cystathionine gamma-synthase
MDERTRLLHAGPDRDPYTGASSVPIYQTSTHAQQDPEHFGRYGYARSDNPTREAVERAIAALEGGPLGLASASGMAAISSALLLLAPGDHVIVSEDVYLKISDLAALAEIARNRGLLALLAVSLGGVESIASYPATMSHAAMPAGERARRGITGGLVRLSVGLEAAEDLVADLEQALSQPRAGSNVPAPPAEASHSTTEGGSHVQDLR